MKKQGPLIIIEPCGCRVDHGIPYRCDQHKLPIERKQPSLYTWRVGDVFTDGMHRWAVDSVHGERAVLRSCASPWVKTILLTFSEWREDGRWCLEKEATH